MGGGRGGKADMKSIVLPPLHNCKFGHISVQNEMKQIKKNQVEITTQISTQENVERW